MPFQDHVMLTLAALAYRGFSDFLRGRIHDEVVREALLDGLDKFEPLERQWELVWGPATTRQIPIPTLAWVSVFDWNACYVVRHRTERNKYVIAVRGTNPIAAWDWLFGDIWVGSQVPWPYGDGSERISTSTALGLAAVQQMRSSHPAAVNSVLRALGNDVRSALHAVNRKMAPILRGISDETAVRMEQRLQETVTRWIGGIAQNRIVREQIQRLNLDELIKPQLLRPKLAPENERDEPIDLLTFLARQAAGESLELAVTGHSKGGALAPVVALWLKEALNSPDECWDKRGTSKVFCYAFAGPTPGNDRLAARIDAQLGSDLHQWINWNDIVPNAFDPADMAKIPSLYQQRTAALAPLVQDLIQTVQPLNYRHPTAGLESFRGELDPNRPFALEMPIQHLDAYLIKLGIHSDQINTFTCFI